MEPLFIPEAALETIKKGVAEAVRAGRLWMLTPSMSVLGEPVPLGLLDESVEFRAPPIPAVSVDLLSEQLPGAWTDGRSNAQLIHAALSSKRGKQLPWNTVKVGLDDAFRLGLIDRSIDSKPWPTDFGGAAGITIQLATGARAQAPKPEAFGARIASTQLEANEVQDLADLVADMKKAAAGQTLKFKVSIELGDGVNVPQGTIDEINALLAKVKPDWKLG